MNNRILLSLLCSLVYQHAHASNIYAAIAQQYLPSINFEVASPKNNYFMVQPLNAQEKKYYAFLMLASQKPFDNPCTKTLLDGKAWENLELYSGANLLNIIHRTQTALGECVLGAMIGQPTPDIPELTRRQQAVRYLLTHETFFHDLNKELRGFSVFEGVTLGFWKEENPMIQEAFKRLYVDDFLPGAGIINSSPRSLELLRRIEDAAMLLLVPFSLLYLRYLLRNRPPTTLSEEINTTVKNPSATWQDKALAWSTLVFSSFDLSVACLNIPICAYQTIHYYSFTHKALQYLHTRYAYVARALTHMQKIDTFITQNKEFMVLVPEAAYLNKIRSKYQALTSELSEMLTLLQSSTFKRPFSYTSHFGTILRVHKLMDTIKHELVPAFEALGYIDSYCSLAHLYKEFKTKRVQFSFASYASDAFPGLSLHDFWNPLVKATSVIPNSVILGFGTHAGSSMILTGQNTGGKSTILKGMALCTLLAQTIGLTPATRMNVTPFNHISTYMNITDNIKEQQSLFAAEVARAKKLLDELSTLPAHKKSFTIIDEAFKGTGAEAQDLSYWYALQLIQYPNNMCINATHYRKLVELEQETKGKYRNYKVEVLRVGPGKLIRTYKLEPGYTLYNIAQDILIEQNLMRP